MTDGIRGDRAVLQGHHWLTRLGQRDTMAIERLPLRSPVPRCLLHLLMCSRPPNQEEGTPRPPPPQLPQGATR